MGRKRERRLGGGEGKGVGKNEVSSKEELSSIQITAPYTQTYYNENHHVLEDFPTLLPQSSRQLAEQPSQQAKASDLPSISSPGRAKGIFPKSQLNKLG